MAEPDDGLRGDMTLGWHLVVFADILGQSDKLRQLTKLPRTLEEKRKTLEVLTETAGLTLRFRENFGDYFATHNEDQGFIDLLPPEQRDIARELRRADVRYRGFSDSVIIDVPLAGNDEHCAAVNGIQGSLSALSSMMTEMLAVRVAIRAGLDVGLGIDIAEGEVYGSALARAYALESKVAKWPRLVVGNELVEYLDAVKGSRSASLRATYARETAEACRALLVEDEDGCMVVDYLSPRLKDSGVSVRKEAIQGAMTFAQAEIERFEDNAKLRPRYESLHRFLQRGAEFWMDQQDEA